MRKVKIKYILFGIMLFLCTNLYVYAATITLEQIAEKFNETLRNNIIDTLVEYEIEALIKQLKDDEEGFRERLADIFINGKKGYNKMPTKTLIDIFLDKKDEGEFINLIEGISNL